MDGCYHLGFRWIAHLLVNKLAKLSAFIGREARHRPHAPRRPRQPDHRLFQGRPLEGLLEDLGGVERLGVYVVDKELLAQFREASTD